MATVNIAFFLAGVVTGLLLVGLVLVVLCNLADKRKLRPVNEAFMEVK